MNANVIHILRGGEGFGPTQHKECKMDMMQAWVVEGEAASLQTVPKPIPGADDALVRVLIAGE